MKTTNCLKCESTNLRDTYNTNTSNLDRICMSCGFIWQELSADVQVDLKDSQRIVPTIQPTNIVTP